VFVAGFFATQNDWGRAYYSDRAEKCAGVFYGGSGDMLAANFVFILAVS
jgi:Amt family ammonium transporter